MVGIKREPRYAPNNNCINNKAFRGMTCGWAFSRLTSKMKLYFNWRIIGIVYIYLQNDKLQTHKIQNEKKEEGKKTKC